MRRMFAAWLILIGLCPAVSGQRFAVADGEAEVPPPSGFARLTAEMEGLHQIRMGLPDVEDGICVYYIPEADAERAKAGEVRPLERMCLLRISETFDVKEIREAVKIEGVEPHGEADSAQTFSMILHYDAAAAGNEEGLAVAVTAAELEAAGHPLFLFCYGKKDDLEWTRRALKEWAQAVTAANPSAKAGETPADAEKIGKEKGFWMTAALLAAGGFIAVGLFLRGRKGSIERR